LALIRYSKKKDLSILNANPAMIGTDPADSILMHTGIVLSGTDPVAVDTINRSKVTWVQTSGYSLPL